MNNFDLGIIGTGVAGAFAAFKIAKEYKNIKTICFDLGRPMHKRRRQLEGWLGLLPSSDGKLYINDVESVAQITGTRKVNQANTWFNNYISSLMDIKINKDKSPSINVEKRIKKAGFDLKLNNHIQLYPKDIHILSRDMSNYLVDAKNISFSFDNEIYKILKQKGHFTIISSNGEFNCKRVIICTGRSGWRWTKGLYESLGIIENNDTAKFGVRVEMSSTAMKDFNKSNCTISKDNLEIGPLCWNGTVIPEDHIDMAISSFRSNENRWKSDKVSFNIIGNRHFENSGFEQTDRIGRLTFILANDRIIREKVSTIMNQKSKISVIPEYDWMRESLVSVSNFIPDLLTRAYFHVPTILPLIPKIKIGNNLVTDVDGMYCAGESAGIVGILAAAVTGLISADSVAK